MYVHMYIFIVSFNVGNYRIGKKNLSLMKYSYYIILYCFNHSKRGINEIKAYADKICVLF